MGFLPQPVADSPRPILPRVGSRCFERPNSSRSRRNSFALFAHLITQRHYSGVPTSNPQIPTNSEDPSNGRENNFHN
jgi:hypothetical protein